MGLYQRQICQNVDTSIHGRKYNKTKYPAGLKIPLFIHLTNTYKNSKQRIPTMIFSFLFFYSRRDSRLNQSLFLVHYMTNFVFTFSLFQKFRYAVTTRNRHLFMTVPSGDEKGWVNTAVPLPEYRLLKRFCGNLRNTEKLAGSFFCFYSGQGMKCYRVQKTVFMITVSSGMFDESVNTYGTESM